MPPTWNYRYVKLVGKDLLIYREHDASEPLSVLKVTDYNKMKTRHVKLLIFRTLGFFGLLLYEQVRPAERSECFQKYTIRLVKNPANPGQKTLLKFEDKKMMDEWLGDLQAIVNLSNSWK